jgi:hypothetical protein
MTLGEGKRRVLMLLDEYSSGGTITEDRDIMNKMADFFDIAQKEIAGHQRIIRKTEFVLTASEGDFTYYDLPEDFSKTFRVWKKGKVFAGYPIISNQLAIPTDESGTITLEYFARPKTITPETPDSYEFEVSEEAANCLPFYVAAQQLVSDLVVDYSAFWSMYLNMRAALDTSLPSSGGGGYVAQRFYGGR